MSETDHDGELTPGDEPDNWTDVDIDTAFAAIVARYGQSGPQIGPWPVAEDGEPAGSGGSHAATEPDRSSSRQHRKPDEPIPSTSVWERHFEGVDGSIDPSENYPDEDGPDEDGDRYVPPDPPPLPRGDFLTTLAWSGVLAGPLLLLVAAAAWHGMPAELVLAGVAAFIGGFVLLVARMPSEHPDDPDDGAIV